LALAISQFSQPSTMPLTVLASVSLLALVVTGRPVLDPDPRLCVPSVLRRFVTVFIPLSLSLFSVEASGEVHNAVLAIIESRLGYVRHIFNWIRLRSPWSSSLSSFQPFHRVYSIDTNISPPPYMHDGLRNFIRLHPHLCRHVGLPRPSRLVKAKTLPRMKINSIFTTQTSKSISPPPNPKRRFSRSWRLRRSS